MIRASKEKPCPICGKPDWCFTNDTAEVAICMRMESRHPAQNGGWTHVIAAPRAPGQPRRLPMPTKPRPSIDAAGIMAAWRKDTDPGMIYDHAQQLGVSPDAILNLGIAWAPEHGAWAWPMKDGHGKTIGIRLRAESGKKWAVKGSKDGIFYSEPSTETVAAMICEGPTDAAAAITIGFWAVGRSACLTGTDHIRDLFIRHNIRLMVIVADNDEPKVLPGDTFWYPGIEGAKRLAQSIRKGAKIILPPAKDLRQWVRDGATRADVEALMGDSTWRIF